MMSTIRRFSKRGSTGGTRTGLLRPWRWRLHCSTFTVDFCDFCEPAVTDCPGEPSRPGIPAPQSMHRRADRGGVLVLPDRQDPPSHPRGTIGGGPITKKWTRTTTRDSRKKTQKTIRPSWMWGQLGSYIYSQRFNFLRKHLFCKNTISITVIRWI